MVGVVVVLIVLIVVFVSMRLCVFVFVCYACILGLWLHLHSCVFCVFIKLVERVCVCFVVLRSSIVVRLFPVSFWCPLYWGVSRVGRRLGLRRVW